MSLLQYGGPNGELGAALRYLNQRYTMPDNKGKALLTDIATEEFGHVEMLQTMIYQLTKDATVEELINAGLGSNFAEHGMGIFPTDASGVPFTVAYFAATGDVLADLSEDMAAEQKARAVYENLIDMTDDPDIIGPLLWLRQREVVHYDRFKELFEYYKSMNLENNKVDNSNNTNMNKNNNILDSINQGLSQTNQFLNNFEQM